VSAHDTAPTATAFPLRDGRIVYRFEVQLVPGGSEEVIDEAQARVEYVFIRLTPWAE